MIMIIFMPIIIIGFKQIKNLIWPFFERLLSRKEGDEEFKSGESQAPNVILRCVVLTKGAAFSQIYVKYPRVAARQNIKLNNTAQAARWPHKRLDCHLKVTARAKIPSKYGKVGD